MWVKENKCVEFTDLFDYAAEERFDDWFPLLCDSCAYVMGAYIKSLRHNSGAYEKIVVVNENGEILNSSVVYKEK
jgi:hypothetical protein